ncbi:MAG: DUF975 family protein [Oscillospiraceae bacterium]
MWSIKEVKSKARTAIKKNYFACLAVCFLMIILSSEYQSLSQLIIDYDDANTTSTIINNLNYTSEDKLVFVQEVEKLCGGKDKIRNADALTIRNAVNKVANEYGVPTDASPYLEKWVDEYITYGSRAFDSKLSPFISGSKTLYSQNNTILKVDTDDSDSSGTKSLGEPISIRDVRNFVNVITGGYDAKLGVINNIIRVFKQKETWRIITGIGSSSVMILLTVFISFPLMVGEKRFFMESRTYHKTKVGRLGFLFKEKCSLHSTWIIFLKNIFSFLWVFTIVMAPVKYFEYQMIDFILAENPKATRKEAFTLSKQMMKGSKKKMCLLYLSLLPWTIIPWFITVGIVALIFGNTPYITFVSGFVCTLVGIFFLNAYTAATKTEVYMALRKEAIKNHYEYSEILNDRYLDIDLMEELEQIKESEDKEIEERLEKVKEASAADVK